MARYGNLFYGLLLALILTALALVVTTERDRARQVYAIALSPGDRQLAVSFLIEIPGPTVLPSLAGVQVRIRLLQLPGLWFRDIAVDSLPESLAFTHDGTILASGDRNGVVKLWDSSTGKLLQERKVNSDTIQFLDFSQDDRYLVASSSLRRSASVLKIPELEVLTKVGGVCAVQFSPDGQHLAMGSGPKLLIRSLPKDKLVTSWRGHELNVRSLAYSYNGALLASGGDDNAVCLWDPNTGEQKWRNADLNGMISHIAFSPDNQFLAVGTTGTAVFLLAASDGRVLERFEGHTGAISGVAFSQNGSRLYSGGGQFGFLGGNKDGVRVWDLPAGRNEKVIHLQSEWAIRDFLIVLGLLLVWTVFWTRAARGGQLKNPLRTFACAGLFCCVAFAIAMVWGLAQMASNR